MGCILVIFSVLFFILCPIPNAFAYPKHEKKDKGVTISDFADSAQECKIYSNYKECVIHLEIENEPTSSSLSLDEKKITFTRDFNAWDFELVESEIAYEKFPIETAEYSECTERADAILNELCLFAEGEQNDQCKNANVGIIDEMCMKYMEYEDRETFAWKPASKVEIKAGETKAIGAKFKTGKWQQGEYSWEIDTPGGILTVGTELSACGTISSSGVYVLNQSVSASGTCFTVTADDVMIDCDGFQISYSTGSQGYGIDLVGENIHNLTVQNCIITGETSDADETIRTGYGVSDLQWGFYIYNNTLNNSLANHDTLRLDTKTYGSNIYAIVENNTMYGDGDEGIYIQRGDEARIINNIIHGGRISIRGKNVTDNWIDSITQCLSMGSDVYYGVVDNNTMYCAGSYTFEVGLSAFDYGQFTNNYIEIDEGNPMYSGVYLASVSNALFENNTVNFTNTVSLRGSLVNFDACAGMTIRNNYIYADNIGTATDSTYFSTGMELDGSSGNTIEDLYIRFGGSGNGETPYCRLIYDDSPVNAYTNITTVNTHDDCINFYAPQALETEISDSSFSNTDSYEIYFAGDSHIDVIRPILINRDNSTVASGSGKIYIKWDADANVTQADYGWAIGDASVTFYNQHDSIVEGGGLTNTSGWTRKFTIPEGHINSSGYTQYTYTASAVTQVGKYDNTTFTFQNDETFTAEVPYDVGVLNNYVTDCTNTLTAGDELVCSIYLSDPSDNPILSSTGTWTLYHVNGSSVATGSTEEIGNGAYYLNHSIPTSYGTGGYYIVIDMSASPTDFIQGIALQDASSCDVTDVNTTVNQINSTVNNIRLSQISDFRIYLSNFPAITAGSTYYAAINSFDHEGQPRNLTTLPTITIYDSNRNTAATGTFSHSADGFYTYSYATSSSALGGLWESYVTVNYSNTLVNLTDYWQISSSPADVVINKMIDTIIPSIVADISITNMGTQASDFEYIYCIVDSQDNKCGGPDDVDYQTGTRYITAGSTWNPELGLEVPSTGTYWFKVKSKALSETAWAGASKQFTAYASDDMGMPYSACAIDENCPVGFFCDAGLCMRLKCNSYEQLSDDGHSCVLIVAEDIKNIAEGFIEFAFNKPMEEMSGFDWIILGIIIILIFAGLILAYRYFSG